MDVFSHGDGGNIVGNRGLSFALSLPSRNRGSAAVLKAQRCLSYRQWQHLQRNLEDDAQCSQRASE